MARGRNHGARAVKPAATPNQQPPGAKSSQAPLRQCEQRKARHDIPRYPRQNTKHCIPLEKTGPKPPGFTGTQLMSREFHEPTDASTLRKH